MESSSFFAALPFNVDKTLRISKNIREAWNKDAGVLTNVMACDAFAELDQMLLEWMVDKLDNEILDEQIDGLDIARIADRRMMKACHYSDVFAQEYQAMKYAYLLMKGIRDMEIPSDPVLLLQKYQDDLYQIDSYYRWFYRAFDQIEENEKYMQVRERIENIYANDYLLQMVPKWNAVFDEQAESALGQCGLVRQDRFFSHYLHAYDGKERIIVIISDALRYECAKELMTKLDMDEKCQACIEGMVGVLPSVTSMGMASLLPHKEVNVDEHMNVTVDGQSYKKGDALWNADNMCTAYQVSGLEDGEHTVTIEVASGSLAVDAIAVIGSIYNSDEINVTPKKGTETGLPEEELPKDLTEDVVPDISTPLPSPAAPTTAPTTTPQPIKTPSVRKGYSFKVKGASYVVTDASKKTVSYRKAANKKIKSAAIPATVKVKANGVVYSFRVTDISAKAFAGCTKLKKVIIGKNVVSIGKEAFSKAKALKKITIKTTTLKKVGKNAIKGIYKKAKISCGKKKLKAYKKLFNAKTGYKKSMKLTK